MFSGCQYPPRYDSISVSEYGLAHTHCSVRDTPAVLYIIGHTTFEEGSISDQVDYGELNHNILVQIDKPYTIYQKHSEYWE